MRLFRRSSGDDWPCALKFRSLDCSYIRSARTFRLRWYVSILSKMPDSLAVLLVRISLRMLVTACVKSIADLAA